MLLLFFAFLHFPVLNRPTLPSSSLSAVLLAEHNGLIKSHYPHKGWGAYCGVHTTRQRHKVVTAI